MSTKAKPVRTEPSARRTRTATGSPTEFVGAGKGGSVRPADDRYMTDAQLDARDAYLLEEIGPDAQQLVAKRGRFRLLLDQLSDDQVAELVDGERPDGVTRDALFSQLEDKVTTMPHGEYRELLESLQTAVDAATEVKGA